MFGIAEIVKKTLCSKSIGLILYQGLFKNANSLGSGKKKHKILAIYVVLVLIVMTLSSIVGQIATKCS